MSSALPDADYSVHVTFSSATGYDFTAVVMLFYVSAKSTTEFTITMRDNAGVAVVAPIGGVVVDWTSISYN
jgi:hypothetical protein